jgi:DNA replication protein DnaC
MSQLVYERMRDSLEQLNLHRALECVDALLDRVGSGDLTTVDVLDQLLGSELSVRRERSIVMRLKLAGLPTVKTIEAFDFAFQPSIDEAQIRDLHTLRFLHKGQNIVFLGPPGCGKTHLATSLGHAAITAGEMVHFTTARELFEKLRAAGNPNAHFRRLTANRAKLLIIDEVGYELLDRVAAAHFFRLICDRYERGSIVITSNKRFTEWGALLGDETLAAAILDRMLHHATTINISGPSYRLKDKRRAGTLDVVDPKGGESA